MEMSYMFGFDETLHLCSLRRKKMQPRPLMLQIEGFNEVLIYFVAYNHSVNVLYS